MPAGEIAVVDQLRAVFRQPEIVIGCDAAGADEERVPVDLDGQRVWRAG